MKEKPIFFIFVFFRKKGAYFRRLDENLTEITLIPFPPNDGQFRHKVHQPF